MRKSIVVIFVFSLWISSIDKVHGRQNEGCYNNHPAWSPDGNFLAFTSNKNGNLDIWTIDLQTNTSINLTEQSLERDLIPLWSPTGEYIAFISTRSGNWDIWLMNSDGSNPINVSETGSYDEDQFVWSPNGKKVAFQSSPEEIWIIDVETFEKDVIPIDKVYSYLDVSWSPDGKLLSFLLFYFPEFQGVGFIDIKTKTMVRVPNSNQFHQVTWASDSQNLLLSDLNDLWILDIQSGEIKQLTNDLFANTSGRWSPDGTKLVYHSNQTSFGELWVLNLADQSILDLTSGIARGAVAAVWSPDNTQVAFVSLKNDGTLTGNIWTINIDGTNAVNITADFCQRSP